MRSTMGVIAFAAAIAAMLFTAAPAQDDFAKPAATRLGFVDIELIIENSTAIRRGLDAVDRAMAQKAADIDAKEREFRRQRFELDKQERVLSDNERRRRRESLSSLQKEIDELKFDFEQEMRARERQIEPVLEKIMAIVTDVAARDGYDMVLRGEVVIYGHERADITPKVIEELDRRTPEIVAIFDKGVASDDADTSAPAPVRETVPGQRPAPARNPEPAVPLIP